MTATHPAPATVNRIAGHLPADSAPTIPLPNTPEERRDLWQDALAAATLYFMGRLAHRDPEVAGEAAHAIFDLEKTRLRHGRDLAGTTLPKPAGLAPIGADETDEAEPDAEGELMAECDGILFDADQGKSVYDKVIPPDEKAAAEAFAKTPEYREVVTCFERLFREDRDAVMPPREGDMLAREWFIRRLRAGRLVGGTVKLKGDG